MSKDQVAQILALGEADAKAAIAKGHGLSVEHLLHYHALKKVGDAQIKNMSYGDFLEAKMNGVFPAEFDIQNDPSFIKLKLMSQ